MRRILLLGLIVLVSSLPGLSMAGEPPAVVKQLEQHRRSLYAHTAPAVVFLSSGGRSGSGFFISDDGLILTNAHVVGSAKKMSAVLYDGTRLKARLIERAAKDIDLALLKVDYASAKLLPIEGGKVPEPGDFVAALGHGEGAVWTFNVGMVSNSYDLSSGERLIQTQIPLNPGNSGGPVINADGRVVAVVTAGIKGANSVNFAVPIGLVPRSFADFAPHCRCVEVRAPKGTPIMLDGRMIGLGPSLTLLPDGKRHELSAVVGGKMLRRPYAGLDRKKISF